jgi:dTDP-4-amino-4,6-dideoxygalactose transaminase
MTVQLLNLHAQYESIKGDIDTALSRVLNSQQFILGSEVSELEKELAIAIGSKFALGVSSGTDALLLALMTLGIGEGDEVITTSYSFFATAGSIHRVGAKIVFVDIEEGSFNIDPLKFREAITPKTKAVIPVHLFGQSAEMNEIMKIAAEHKIAVIEDCAQSQGAKYAGKEVGSIGDCGCFSFFPSKNLGCFGDGGAVTWQDSKLFDFCKSLRGHGMSPTVRYLHEYVGGNFRIDALQAAILRAKLPYLQEWIGKRRVNAGHYFRLFEQALGSEKLATVLKLPKEMEHCFHTYNQFVIRVPFRDKLLAKAKEKDIGVMIYYPFPLHLQPCFEYLGYEKGSMPFSEQACVESIALPIYPELPNSDLEQVVDLVIGVGKEEGYL